MEAYLPLPRGRATCVHVGVMKPKDEIIYGLHAVRHAIEHSAESVLELWVQNNKQASAEISNIIRTAEAAGISIQSVAVETLKKHTGAAVHQGLAARRRIIDKLVDLDTLLTQRENSVPLFLVLDGIQDPHNLGACLRTADAAGVEAVIIPKDRAVAVTTTVRKVASGGAENIPVITVTNIARTLKKMQQAGIWIFGTDDETNTSLYEVDLKIPLAIVMGAEGKGLRHNTRKHCDCLVSIPMRGITESLNVSVATGICLYEVLRQRHYVS